MSKFRDDGWGLDSYLNPTVPSRDPRLGKIPLHQPSDNEPYVVLPATGMYVPPGDYRVEQFFVEGEVGKGVLTRAGRPVANVRRAEGEIVAEADWLVDEDAEAFLGWSRRMMNLAEVPSEALTPQFMLHLLCQEELIRRECDMQAESGLVYARQPWGPWMFEPSLDPRNPEHLAVLRDADGDALYYWLGGGRRNLRPEDPRVQSLQSEAAYRP